MIWYDMRCDDGFLSFQNNFMERYDMERYFIRDCYDWKWFIKSIQNVPHTHLVDLRTTSSRATATNICGFERKILMLSLVLYVYIRDLLCAYEKLNWFKRNFNLFMDFRWGWGERCFRVGLDISDECAISRLRSQEVTMQSERSRVSATERKRVKVGPQLFGPTHILTKSSLCTSWNQEFLWHFWRSLLAVKSPTLTVRVSDLFITIIQLIWWFMMMGR